MPIHRVTIKTQVWRKLKSLQKREKHANLKKQMTHLAANTKVTFSPSKDAILWEPTEEFRRAAAIALTEELTFQRKPDSQNCQFIRDVITDLMAGLEPLEDDITEGQDKPDQTELTA